jgi:RHO1 GDP-GTP exchange protein 1/2
MQAGRSGGVMVLYAESSAARDEWKLKLNEALGLRKVVQESNRVFEIETLNINTFYMYPNTMGQSQAQWQEGHALTGKVTCSVPFSTSKSFGCMIFS